MNFWKIGEIYIVHAPGGGVMGKLIDVNQIEVVFERVDCEPPKIESTTHCDLYAGDGIVLISRNTVTSAERFTKQPA